MDGKTECPKCEKWLTLRIGGLFPRHKLPKPTGWARGSQPLCPGSQTRPDEWKPKPVKPGQFNPLPFEAILSTDGKFYRAAPWQHYKVADALGYDWDDLVKEGWLRISAGLVHFAFTYREPTQAQLDAIADYAQFMGWPIVDVFDTPTRQQAARVLLGL